MALTVGDQTAQPASELRGRFFQLLRERDLAAIAAKYDRMRNEQPAIGLEGIDFEPIQFAGWDRRVKSIVSYVKGSSDAEPAFRFGQERPL